MGLSAAILTIVVAMTMLRPLPAHAAGESAAFSAAADQIVADTNAFRAEHGLGAVSFDATISDDVAEPWATRMAETGSFNHNPSVSEKIPAGWSAWGENIAFGFDDDDVVAAWIASPEHRANLLGDFNHLGIGYAVDASGTAWLVQDFAKYPKAAAQASASSASAGSASTTAQTAAAASVPRGTEVARKGKKIARIHHLKVRSTGHAALRVSGSTRAHSALRVHISGPKGADTVATLRSAKHGRFALVWNGSGRVGTYAITVRYLVNRQYVPAHAKWTMTFIRTP